MKKFITILFALILMSITYTARAQMIDFVQSKEINESCTIVKDLNYVFIDALNLEGEVKEGKTMKVKIEWKYYGMCVLSIITNEGEELQIERWSGDNLKFKRLKSADGHYSYGLANNDFLFFALAWSPNMKFDDGSSLNEGYSLIVKTKELD